MMKSLSTGVSGLNINSEAMGVIGDNIANVKTVGFKSNSISFSSLLGHVLEGDTVGSGARIWDTDKLWLQGVPENTGNGMDLAINGDGLFMLKAVPDTGTAYYSRAGEFGINNSGYLVNPDGYRVQGYEVTDPETQALGTIQDIQITSDTVKPQPTSEINLSLNLDADSTEPYSTSVTVYDSLGSPVVITLDFTPDAADGGQPWTWTASVDPDVTSTPVTSTGSISFGADGQLTGLTDNPVIDVTGLVSGAEDLSVTWDLLDASGDSNGSVTGYSTASSVISLTQDGYTSGILKNISVTEDGFVTALYSNGQLVPKYQLALAGFNNYRGLKVEGNNLYSETMESGQPLVGAPETGRLGEITPGALEMSNVDLATEFVHLITTQRAFQANSKVITVSDEMLAELMNIKR